MARREGAGTPKITCQVCRARKVRCDGKRPACDRCIRSKRDCTYTKKSELSFRHSELSRALLPASNPEHQRNNLDTNTPEEHYDTQSHSHVLQSPQPHSSTEPGSVHSPHLLFFSVESPEQPSYSGHPRPDFLPDKHARSSLSLSAPVSSVTACVKPPIRRLTPLEGELLHFYVCNVGPWLDVTSPERHYTYTVPRLALQAPLLFYAVMSCSAHILRLLSKRKRDALADDEDRYQHQCVSLLIPVLDDLVTAVQDEVVLATIVILRMSEQYDEFHVDRQFHLVPQAFSHFVAAGPSSTALGGLREATFYSYVKSDIRMAILGKCPTRMRLDSWPLDTSSPVSDADWANRMTWLAVQAINYCYGKNVPGLLPGDEILRLVDEWREQVPSTFEPYYYEEGDSSPFPTIRLLCPWHAVGLQFYHTCKILLATHGLDKAPITDILQFNRHVTSGVLPHVRMLCAISFSNEHYGCRINSSHLLAMGAQFFTGRQEQREVLNYFRVLQEENAWPSRACREMLESAYVEGFNLLGVV